MAPGMNQHEVTSSLPKQLDVTPGATTSRAKAQVKWVSESRWLYWTAGWRWESIQLAVLSSSR